MTSKGRNTKAAHRGPLKFVTATSALSGSGWRISNFVRSIVLLSPTFTCSRFYQFTFKFRQTSQDGQHKAASRGCRRRRIESDSCLFIGDLVSAKFRLAPHSDTDHN